LQCNLENYNFFDYQQQHNDAGAIPALASFFLTKIRQLKDNEMSNEKLALIILNHPRFLFRG